MKDLRWEDVPAVSVLPGVTKQMVQGKNGMVIRYCYAPRCVFPDHRHPQEQITVVSKGALEFRVDGKPIMCTEGSLLVIPSGMVHGATVIGDETVESLNFLSPLRTEEIEIC